MFGSRQSSYPQRLKLLAFVNASVHAPVALSGACTHIRPVRLSVMQPALEVKRVPGHTTPAWTLPSSPAA